MIRRAFTAASIIAFILVLAVAFYARDDSRFTLWHVGIILHPDNQMAIRLPRGTVWAFNSMLAYVPAVICFLTAIIWKLRRLQ